MSMNFGVLFIMMYLLEVTKVFFTEFREGYVHEFRCTFYHDVPIRSCKSLFHRV